MTRRLDASQSTGRMQILVSTKAFLQLYHFDTNTTMVIMDKLIALNHQQKEQESQMQKEQRDKNNTKKRRRQKDGRDDDADNDDDDDDSLNIETSNNPTSRAYATARFRLVQVALLYSS